MFDKDKFKELAKERENTDWDYKIEKIWNEMKLMILENDDSFKEFIEYMKIEMSGDEYGTLSEISDDISQEKPSYEFIDAYKFLAEKYPEETKKWNIISFIADAEEIVKDSLEEK
ncbi:hypothetical protein KMP11_06045 [Gemella sp. zg-570]|uniref:hypothetical protein n=1 Tax=Gemella sp. zg-570 TaxID=2840371 RepID=UPI001C0B92A9|nr:hypothetical protein [Gemella sp. zg-570]QWQ38511.1 hypothetical protein KMP11_06045 [Gemella sp. zg-570]